MSPSPPAPAGVPPAAAASRGRGCERGAGGRDGRGAGRRGLQREPEPGAVSSKLLGPRRYSAKRQEQASEDRSQGPAPGAGCQHPGTEEEADLTWWQPFSSAPPAGRREDGPSRCDVPSGLN